MDHYKQVLMELILQSGSAGNFLPQNTDALISVL